MKSHAIVGLIGIIGACIIWLSAGCAEHKHYPGPPSAAVMFAGAPDTPDATDIGRSDWPSVADRYSNGEFTHYAEYLNDYQGGWGNGGYGPGGWNYFSRQFTSIRHGSQYR